MIRPCRLCGRMVDFSEPWCDHETMEESAWLDIKERMQNAVDSAVEQAAKELLENKPDGA